MYVTIEHEDHHRLVPDRAIGEVGSPTISNLNKRHIAFMLGDKPALGVAWELDLAHAGFLELDHDIFDTIPGLAQSIDYDGVHDPRRLDYLSRMLRRKIRGMLSRGVSPIAIYRRCLAEGDTGGRVVQ